MGAGTGPFINDLVPKGDGTPSAGDLLYIQDADTIRRLPSGLDGDVLTMVSGLPDWAAGGGGGSALTVEEVDGSPTDSAITKIVFPNGTLSIASHVATFTPAAGFASPLTTKGDVHVYDTGDARLAVGSNGKILNADSAQAKGVGYSTRDLDAGGFKLTNLLAPGHGTNEAATAAWVESRTIRDLAVRALASIALSNGPNNNAAGSGADAYITPNPTLDFSVSGWQSTGLVDGFRWTLYYTGSLNFTITHQGSGSTSTNRIICPRGVDLVMAGPCAVEFQWDATTSRWRIANYAAGQLDISALAAKSTPTTSDYLIIYDLASSSHKRISIGDLPVAFGGTLVVAPGDAQNDFDGDGSTVTFTASSGVAASNGVFINGNIQPLSAFSISGNNVTFTTAPNAGDKITWRYFTSAPSSQTPTQENFTGDGVTTDFTLAHTPVTNSTQVFAELLLRTTEWSIVAPATVRFVTAPISGTRIGVLYRY